MLRVENGHVVRQFKISSGHWAGALLAQGQQHISTTLQAKDNALEVQQKIDDVLLNALHGGILVYDPSDLHLSGGVALHGGQQDAAKGIAQCVTKPTLKRLHHNLGRVGAGGFDFNNARL